MQQVYQTSALVVHCIDYRFQSRLDSWLSYRLGHGNYDRAALAGGVYDLETVLKQVEIANRLHNIQKVLLANHEDCGAYGRESTFNRHKADLDKAEREIKARFPHLHVETYYLRLNGEFEKLPRAAP